MSENNCEVCISKSVSTPKFGYGRFVLPAISGLIILAAWLALAKSDMLSYLLGVLGAIVAGTPILKCGFEQLVKTIRKRDIAELNMGVLVSIALLSSLYIGESIAAATVAFIMIVGMLLEDLTLWKAHNAVSNIMSLIPSSATVRRGNKVEVVPIGDVKPGDTVIVKTGERIPVDGIVRHGQGSVNQAPITGEAMPVNKNGDDEVFEGTLLVEGYFEFEASRTGQDSTLAKIAKLVEQSQQSKTNFQRVADRFANYFTPAILFLGIATYCITADITRAITVLVVACPCSLVLAAPTAIIATVARCARKGIVIKGGAPLEAAGMIDTVVFDKTGTLTEGTPHLHQIVSTDSVPDITILSLAATAESASEHPLARCIVQAARARGVEVHKPEDIKVHIGKGVSIRHRGRQVIVGRKQLFQDLHINLPGDLLRDLAALEAQGQTVVVVSDQEKAVGVLCLTDKVKESSGKVVGMLSDIGIQQTAILTGDNMSNAKRVAEQLSIKEFYAELLPEDKMKIIKDFHQQGRRVAMVGDGINDAPALAEAAVGIAMGKNGTDVAVEVAGIAIMSDEPSKIPYALKACRQAYRVIKGNIWASIIVNLFAIGLSATGILTPITGALVHNVASFFVVGNSARLIRG